MEIEIAGCNLYDDEDPNYITFDSSARHETEEHLQLMWFNQNGEEYLPLDCIYRINQYMLEATDTHVWAARSVLEPIKSVPIQDPFRISVGAQGFAEKKYLIGAYTCDGETNSEISIHAFNPTKNNYKHADTCSIPVASNDYVSGVTINQANPEHCAIQYTSKGDHGCICIFDIQAQKVINTFRSGTIHNGYTNGLQQPALYDNDMYYGNRFEAYHFDMRSNKKSLLLSISGRWEELIALTQYNGIPYIATGYITSDTLAKIDLRTKKSVDICQTKNSHVFIHNPKLICGQQNSILQDRSGLLLINNKTGKYQSYSRTSDNSDDSIVAFNDSNELIECDIHTRYVKIFNVKQLPKEEIGSHIKTIEAAAALRAFHHERKPDEGPVCNDGFAGSLLNKKDFSPQLWSIIRAQGFETKPYFKRTPKIEDKGWCSLQ